MNYFIAYTFVSGGMNFYNNTILNACKKVETIGDIKNMEERITGEINSLIKESIEIGTLEKINMVRIVNYKEIGEKGNFKRGKAGRDEKAAVEGDRKKTKIPDEIFKSKVQRLNEEILKMLGKY